MIQAIFVTLTVFAMLMFLLGVILGGKDEDKVPVFIILGIASVLFGALAMESFNVGVTFCALDLANSTSVGNLTTFNNTFSCVTDQVVEPGMGAVFVGMFFLTIILMYINVTKNYVEDLKI